MNGSDEGQRRNIWDGIKRLMQMENVERVPGGCLEKIGAPRGLMCPFWQSPFMLFCVVEDGISSRALSVAETTDIRRCPSTGPNFWCVMPDSHERQLCFRWIDFSSGSIDARPLDPSSMITAMTRSWKSLHVVWLMLGTNLTVM